MSPRTHAPPLPSFVQIEPVGRCNLACRMCAVPHRVDPGEPEPAPGQDHGQAGPNPRPVVRLRPASATSAPPRLLDPALFRRIVDGMPQLRELHLQGLGEPLLHPEFFELVAHAAARGIEVSTNSNLTLMTAARARRCVHSGLARLHVSIDAADPDTYAAIRLGGRLDRVLRNLDRLVEARAQAALPRPEIHLVMVLMRCNLGQLPAMVRLAIDHGVDSLSVQRLAHDFSEEAMPARYQPMREHVASEMLSADDIAGAAPLFEHARALARDAGLLLRLPQAATPATGEPTFRRSAAPGASHAAGSDAPPPGRCDWPWRGGYLAWNGDAMPCCMIGTPDRGTLGNVREQAFADIWTAAPYAAWRAAMRSDAPPDVCRGCAAWRGEF